MEGLADGLMPMDIWRKEGIKEGMKILTTSQTNGQVTHERRCKGAKEEKSNTSQSFKSSKVTKLHNFSYSPVSGCRSWHWACTLLWTLLSHSPVSLVSPANHSSRHAFPVRRISTSLRPSFLGQNGRLGSLHLSIAVSVCWNSIGR